MRPGRPILKNLPTAQSGGIQIGRASGTTAAGRIFFENKKWGIKFLSLWRRAKSFIQNGPLYHSSLSFYFSSFSLSILHFFCLSVLLFRSFCIFFFIFLSLSLLTAIFVHFLLRCFFIQLHHLYVFPFYLSISLYSLSLFPSLSPHLNLTSSHTFKLSLSLTHTISHPLFLFIC